ncbi:nuclear transport factor 2 family protein [Planctomycetota bacterium]
MKIFLKVILVLSCISVLWAVQDSQGDTTTEKEAAIKKAILKVHSEMMKAAKNLDVEALFSHVLDMNMGVIVQDGRIMTTRQEALNSTRQGLQGLNSVSYKYNRKHTTVISPTVALWVADGTTSATIIGDAGDVSVAFAETIVFVKRGGQWKVLHAHRSIPNPR